MSLFDSKNLTEAQQIAIELQWAVYQYLERLRDERLERQEGSEQQAS